MLNTKNDKRTAAVAATPGRSQVWDEWDEPWRANPVLDVSWSGTTPQLRALVRYAVLAPSGHNAQPWQFRVGHRRVDVLADLSRWPRVADPDGRELHVSLGCALENLLIAAEHLGGLGHEVAYFPDPAAPAWAASVRFRPGGARAATRPDGLFDMIPVRRTNRRPYDGRPVPPDALRQLGACCAGRGGRIGVDFLDGAEDRWRVDALVACADAIECADPAYRSEMGAAVGRGAFGDPWPLSRLGQLATASLDLGYARARHDSRLLLSAPVFGVVSTAGDTPALRVRAGQAFERLWLTATRLGLQLQPMTQVLQVGKTKRELRATLSLGELVPQQSFRLGYAPPHRRAQATRRPARDVLLDGPAHTASDDAR